jgi:hypothetical protein
VEPPRQDPTGKGQGLSSPYRGYRLRPSKRCRRGWRAAEISVDPAFRPVLKGDRIQDAPLSAFSAAQIVKHRRARGPRSGAYAGHSLRSRFLTTAEAGASMFKMAERRTCRAPICSGSTRAGSYEHEGLALAIAGDRSWRIDPARAACLEILR